MSINRLLLRLGALLLLVMLPLWVVSAQEDSQIIFGTVREEAPQLYRMNPNGTDIVDITPDIMRRDLTVPFSSPDGSLMAYISFLEGFKIFVMDANGENARRLTLTDDLLELNFSWSPDSSYIVFAGAATLDEAQNLYVVDVEDGEQRQLTFGDSNDKLPQWSPDGTQILYISDVFDDFWAGIYTTDISGMNQRLIYEANRILSASWSPDSARIAFSTQTDEGVVLYTMTTDGDNLQQLTTVEQVLQAFDPLWSPNGSQIAFQGGQLEEAEIYAINTDGTNLRQLTENTWSDSLVQWIGSTDSPYSVQLRLGQTIITDAQVESIVDSQQVRLPNCGAPGTLTISRTFERSQSRVMSINNTQAQEMCTDVAAGGETAISASSTVQAGVAESEVEASASAWVEVTEQVCNMVQTEYGYTEGTEFSESVTLTLEAPANSQVTYQVNWVMTATSGLLEVMVGEDIYYMPFSIPNQLSVTAQPIESDPCDP